MDEEADLIIKKYNLKKVNEKWTLKIFHWTLWKNNLILLLGWIWKIQAAFSYLQCTEPVLQDPAEPWTIQFRAP